MLVIEDGTGIDGANSLITLEYADEFLDMFGDCWCGCVEEKERYIKLANYMMLTLPWSGTLIDPGQQTPFPRIHAYDKCADPCCDKTRIERDEIPEKVKQATALLALGLCSGGITPFTDQRRGMVSSFSVGDISVNFENHKGIHVDDIQGGNCEVKAQKCDPMPQIKGLLSCFMEGPNSLGGKVRSVNVVQSFSSRNC